MAIPLPVADCWKIDYRIEFPAKVTLGQLPKGVTYGKAPFEYQATYEKDGRALVVTRALKCSARAMCARRKTTRRGRPFTRCCSGI